MTLPRIIVRTVPEREDYAAYLRDRLPEAEWCVDRAHDPVGNFLAALTLQGDDDAIHLDDDVVLARDWRILAEGHLAVRRGHPIQWFSARPKADERGARWERHFIGTQCFHLPGRLAPGAVEWFDTWPGSPHPSLHPQRLFDVGLGAYLRSLDERVWVTCPSLVQHRLGPSAMGHHLTGGYQATFTHPLDLPTPTGVESGS